MMVPRTLCVGGVRFILSERRVPAIRVRDGKRVDVAPSTLRRRPDLYRPRRPKGPEPAPRPPKMPPMRPAPTAKPPTAPPAPAREGKPQQPHREQFLTGVRTAVEQAKRDWQAKLKGKHLEKGEGHKNPFRKRVEREFAATEKLLNKHGRALKFGVTHGLKVHSWVPNPDYDPTKDDQMVGKVVNYDGTWENRYTASFTKRNNMDKFLELPKIVKSAAKLLRRTSRDMNDSNKPHRQMTAFAVALINDSLIRVGDAEEGDDEAHIGLTSLRKKNIKFFKGKDGKPYFKIEYVGKTGVEHFGHRAPTVTDPKLVKTMQQVLANKRRGELVFQTADGRQVTPAHVNKYLKRAGFHTGKAKTFRFYKATVMAQDRHDSVKPPAELVTPPQDLPKDPQVRAAIQEKRRKAFDAWYDHNIVAPISRKLGHSMRDRDKEGRPIKHPRGSLTTRTHYIDLNLQAAYYRKYGFELPDRVANAMKEYVEKKKKKPKRKKRAAEVLFVQAQLLTEEPAEETLDPAAQRLVDTVLHTDPELVKLPDVPYLDPDDDEDDDTSPPAEPPIRL